jgi:exosome complex RNA-binding protein Rrp42 (RNase PH superfamily)
MRIRKHERHAVLKFVTHEARTDGRYLRSFELVKLETLGIERRAGDAQPLSVFQR